MAIIVTEGPGGYTEVQTSEPEDTWIRLLAGKMLCDELSVLSFALERGLIELMGIFAKPEVKEVQSRHLLS